MEHQDIRITVFTPTYNRAKHLPNLYASLCAQDCRAFEWIVVDQGEDEAEALVRGYREEADFPVIYHRLTGERGIARALNAAVGLARGRLFMKVDDDDRLTPDAMSTVLAMEQTIDDPTHYAGVSGLRVYPDGTVIGDPWRHETDWVDCTNLERGKFGLNGDKAEVYYLDVLKRYGPIPTVPGEYYTWESLLWDKIAHAGLPIRWFNRRFYVTEYLPGGATASRGDAKLKNFMTWTLVVADQLTYNEIPFRRRLKISCRYFELLRRKGLPFRAVRRHFRRSMPLALMGYIGSLVTRRMSGKPPQDGGIVIKAE